MKKIVALLLIASVAQGSLLLGEYENLQVYLTNSEITKVCLANPQRRSDSEKTKACNFLEKEFARVREEQLVYKSNDLSDQQSKDEKKYLYTDYIVDVLDDHNWGNTKCFVAKVTRASHEYQKALKRAVK